QAPICEGDAGDVLQKVRTGDFTRPRCINAAIPAPLEAICLKAMAIDPDQRYPSCAKLAEDTEHWLADEPVSAWPEPWTERTRRWLGRHRTTVSTTAAALLVTLVGSIIGLFLLAAAEGKERKAKEDQAAARQTAEEKEKEVRHNLYVAEMNLIQKEY